MTHPSTPHDRTAFRQSLRRDAFSLPAERIQVTYCTRFCGEDCICSLAAEKRDDEKGESDAG